MGIEIGCAVWAYKGWVGNLFPAGTRPSEFLRLYSQQFTVVEGNTTFYSVPDATAIARWVAETPVGFQFCPKLPKQLTHAGLLQPQLPAMLQFVHHMQALGDRLGPLFLQLPPTYAPAQVADLKAVLVSLAQQATEFALEVRHPDWFKSPHEQHLAELLATCGVGRVVLDSRPIYEGADDPQVQIERRKPQLPVPFSVTAPFSLIRFISHPTWQDNVPFLQDWITPLKQWSSDRRIYFFVHCPIEEQSPHNAIAIHQFLGQQGLPVPPRQPLAIPPSPVQLNLF